MICHKTKCIFVHIPRTAGTSIEIGIQGKDQWAISAKTKHLIAEDAKKLYSDYWDEYFKFSFVRNPWDRMISMCKYGNDHPREWNRTYGVSIKTGKLNMDKYFEIYSNGIEEDPRFKKNVKRKNIIKNAVYLNILNEELDFIGKFENLKNDVQYISHKLNKKIILPRAESSNHGHYSKYYNESEKNLVSETYKLDIEKFKYFF
tara:strand:+ start:300 stop:908 length:609 start_codon:yes stop_codon:yes gene_type:complete